MLDAALMELMRAIVRGDAAAVSQVLAISPALAAAALRQGATRQGAKDCYVAEIGTYFYAGATALHAAAAAYRKDCAQQLIALGADIHARDRRGAQPLHAAAVGMPGSAAWDPSAQAATVAHLIAAGADPNAVDIGGVAPLHRAVRTRCASAVRALLEGGADPHRGNRSGSTPMRLATANTGRGGSGSAEARAQQAEIVRLLQQYGAMQSR